MINQTSLNYQPLIKGLPSKIKTWTDLSVAFSLLTDKKIVCCFCQQKKISQGQLIFCSENCRVKEWIEGHGYSKNKAEVLSNFAFFEDLPKSKKMLQDFRRKAKNRKLDRHEDKFHIQNYYREQLLKMELEKRDWKLINEPLKEGKKFKDNLLIFFLKKVVDKNLTYSSYIYKTCFFLHNTHDAHTPTMGQKEDELIPTKLPIWGGIKLREQFGAAYNKKPYFLLNFKSSNSFIHKGHKLKQKIKKI